MVLLGKTGSVHGKKLVSDVANPRVSQCQCSHTLLRAVGRGRHWVLEKVLTGCDSYWQVSGIPSGSMGNIGTHSLKATTLSWIGYSLGAPISIRQHLGYHMPSC